MKVRIKLFAELREKVGKSEVVMDAEYSSVRDVLEEFDFRYAKILKDGRLLENLLVFKNGRACSPEDQVLDGDELALIPPVSGG